MPILGPLHGVGRRMEDFTDLDDIKRSLFVRGPLLIML
jgi:hypothetical protein